MSNIERMWNMNVQINKIVSRITVLSRNPNGVHFNYPAMGRVVSRLMYIKQSQPAK